MTSLRKVTHSTCCPENENGVKFNLAYMILVDEVETKTGILENYGIEIQMQNEHEQMNRAIHGITLNSEKIEHIAALLSHGQVFPESLLEVLEDLLA